MRCSTTHKGSKVQADLENLVKDLQGVLSNKNLDSLPGIHTLRERAQDSISNVRDAAVSAAQQTKEAAIATDQYAHEEPWRVAGAALAVGALVGFLLSRR